jgi:hypothetical protein
MACGECIYQDRCTLIEQLSGENQCGTEISFDFEREDDGFIKGVGFTWTEMSYRRLTGGWWDTEPSEWDLFVERG